MRSASDKISMERTGWIVATICCLIGSIVSLFVTIITYTTKTGIHYKYNVIDFINYQRFANEVLTEYSGSMFLTVEDSAVRIIAVVGVIAIIGAIIGIGGMSLQRKNTWPFILALIGLIGTIIPSVSIFVVIILSNDYFQGKISCGLYPIITPIAMIICIITVSWKRKKNRDELEAERIAGQFIHRAGDL